MLQTLHQYPEQEFTHMDIHAQQTSTSMQTGMNHVTQNKMIKLEIQPEVLKLIISKKKLYFKN